MNVKLEQEMPKLTGKAELNQYYALTLVISGEKDIFFPSHVVKQAAAEIIANVESETAELRSFLIIMLFTGTF
ncbi:MAG: alpha/beta hydrolase [Paenibacillus sp.]|nr:alpha/beta hydrolase [Paenibacillus sp.]